MKKNIEYQTWVNLGVYLVGGIILMLTFRHKKFGSILGKEKNA